MWVIFILSRLSPLRDASLGCIPSGMTASLLDLSFLDSQISASQSTLNHLGSMSSVSSMGPSKRHTQKRHQLPSTVSLASSMEGSEPSGVINEVARAQPHKASTSMQSLSPSNGSSQRTPKSKLSRSKDRLIDGNRTKAMTPIREFEEDNQASKSKHLSMGPSKGSKTSSKSSSKSTEVSRRLWNVSCLATLSPWAF